MRTFAFAAIAALALATGASAHEIRVPVAGKSAVQLHTEILSAARSVCHKATATETLMLDAYTRCLSGTMKHALSQLGDPEVAKIEDMRLAAR